MLITKLPMDTIISKQGEVDMEKYEAPELEIIRFESEDIITTSLAANELSILWEDDSGDF